MAFSNANSWAFIAFLLCFTIFILGNSLDEDKGLDFVQLVEKYKYPIELHSVTTQDGYILRLYRIPHGLRHTETNQNPALLVLGMFGNAANFILLGYQNISLIYYLANQGYDVWILHVRGNNHSKQHVTLNATSPDFWKFSWHEMGLYDLPATIDYVLSATNKQTLTYFGYSQGATSFTVMCSTLPKMNSKISLAVLMAPPIYFTHFPNGFVRDAAFSNTLIKLAISLNIYELVPGLIFDVIRPVIPNICTPGSSLFYICWYVIHDIVGMDPMRTNKDVLPLFSNDLPTVSTRQLFHYGQLIRFPGHFRPYIFGKKENIQKYGSPLPADYNLSNIIVPVAIFYSKGDKFCNYKDVQHFSTKLSNLVYTHLSPIETFGHVDYYATEDCKTDVLDPLDKFLRNYSKL